jgi:hypothetical protein
MGGAVTVKILGLAILINALVFAALTLLLIGCVSSPQPSPLSEMFAANARGEIACVRNGVLVHGRAGCK